MMSEAADLLKSSVNSDPRAAESLFPVVYDALKELAAARVAHLPPGQTLQPTALVHEVYLKLIGTASDRKRWASESHFFFAAAEAMRHVQIDAIRRKNRIRRGGGLRRLELVPEMAEEAREDVLLDVHEAMDAFTKTDPETAELVKLHIFAGFTIEEAADLLGLSVRTAWRDWAFARAWMGRYLDSGRDEPQTT